MGILANENSISAGGYNIANSLRFQSASSQYLSRTPASAGSQTTWTFNFWIKRGILSSVQTFMGARVDGTNYFHGYINSSDQLIIDGMIAGVQRVLLTTTQVFRDPSSWYMVTLIADSTNATSSDRFRVYVNGNRVTAFSSATYPSASAFVGNWNTNIVNEIGRYPLAINYTDGYMTEINFIDGQALTPSSFGETNTLTGQWVAKKYAGTYGTNGFYLPFSNGTSTTTLGADSSGNGNNWTLTNFTRSAGVSDCWMKDVPSGNGGASGTQPNSNYAVLNPLDKSTNATLSQANLKIAASTTTHNASRAGIAVSSGKWYYEVTVLSANIASNNIGVGVMRDTSTLTSASLTGFASATTWVLSNNYNNTTSAGSKANNGTVSSYGSYWTTNDTVGVAVDVDSGSIELYKNGVSQGVAFSSQSFGTVFPFVVVWGSDTAAINFGQRSFAYTPPSGFKALCTANLPDSTIVKGNQYMDAKLYTGIGATQTITGYNFQPELVWVKARSAAYDHKLVDVVRGLSGSIYRDLESNTTDAEGTPSDGISSLNSDGFTITGGGNPGYNGNTTTFVAWAWDAGSSTVTNTNGTISSQVRANATAGVSVVTYTGNGVTGATIGHGLGVAPKMIIVKGRNVASDWIVYHQGQSASPQNGYLVLNRTDAYTASAIMWNNTAPSSSVITLGSNLAAAYNFVAYAFAEIAGFSKFGSYTGNYSLDGTFVYTGFRPAFIMIKAANNAYEWLVVDTKRSPYNYVDDYLKPNTSDVESANLGSTNALDILSNGFKLRSTWTRQNDTIPYIYMAFASNPFSNSNAH